MHQSDVAECDTTHPTLGRRAQSWAPRVRCSRGAVFVEFLIAFLPIYTFFLCLVQLALLSCVRLLTEHAAVNAARAAAVVLAEPKGRYPDAAHQLASKKSARYRAILDAAVLSLSPLILNGSVADIDLAFPPEASPGAPERGFPVRFRPMSDATVTKLRVRVEVSAICRIGLANRIACPTLGLLPTTKVRAEAVYPYQGARYE